MSLLFTLLQVLTALYAFGGVWVYLRKARKRQLVRRIYVVLLLLFLMALLPIQYATDYSVSLTFGPVLILAVSVGAFLAEVILVWRESRLLGLAGIPGFVAALVVFFSLFSMSNWMFDLVGIPSLSPFMAGRLSPVLSYRVTAAQGFFGGGKFYRYEIYTNPHRFPFVQRRILTEPVPEGCDDPEGIRSGRIVPEISLGPDGKTLHLTCMYPDGEIRAENGVDVRLEN